jgi:hypothetical protein
MLKCRRDIWINKLHSWWGRVDEIIDLRHKWLVKAALCKARRCQIFDVVCRRSEGDAVDNCQLSTIKLLDSKVVAVYYRSSVVQFSKKNETKKLGVSPQRGQKLQR